MISRGGPAESTLARLSAWADVHPTAVDALVAAGIYVLVSAGVTSRAEAQHDAGKVIGVLINAVLCGPLVLRRRTPMLVLAAVATGGMLVALWFGPTGGEASVLLALETAVSCERDPRRVWIAVAAVLVGLTATVLLLRPEDPLPRLVGAGAMVTAAVAIGTAVRARRGQRAAMADRIARLERERIHEVELAAATERARIARELHDVVAHNVSVMIALADGAQHTIDADPRRARQAIEEVATTGREALTELRGLLGVLRAPSDGEGQRTPQPGIDQIDELIDRVRTAGLLTRLRVSGAPRPVSPVTQITIYRIVQEALTNSLRHAHNATRAEVHLCWSNDSIAIEIADDGSAGSVSSTQPLGRGTTGMRERALMHGATLDIGPHPNGGWRVATRIPLGSKPIRRS